MATDITHIESWAVAITPDPGEEWALIPAGGSYQMRPDLILLQVTPGLPVSVTGSGRRTRKHDGTVGALRVNAPWRELDDLPDWARKLADDALAEHGLNRITAHEIVPLPGSVLGRNRLRIRDDVTEDNTRLYPLTAMCSRCHGPIGRSAPDAGWEHQS